MASTYSTNLALELIGTGDQAGTWGNTTNTNLGTLIEQAISGYVTQAITSGTTLTLTIPNGTSGVARNMYIEFTGTGSTVIVPSNKKIYFVYNNCSSGDLTFKVAGQTGVTVLNGQKKLLVSDGTDIVEAITGVNGSGGSTDNAIVRWDGTSGTALQNSSITINDSGVLTTSAEMLVDGIYIGDAGVSSNIIVGQRSATITQTGSFGGNVIIGRNAAESILPYLCVYIGDLAGGFASTATNNSPSSNVAIGYQALSNNLGSNNVGIGRGSLQSGSVLNGSNTAVGYECMRFALTNGDQNTAIGYQAFASGDYDNSTCLGSLSSVTGSNQVQLGDSATTTYAYGAVQDRSDERDKADIQDTQLGLDFIMALRPRDYRWDMREDYRPPKPSEEASKEEWDVWAESAKFSNLSHDGTYKRNRFHHGLVAQEVKAAMDSLGIDFGGYQDHSIKGGDDVLSIGYNELIGPLIKAIQELKAEFDEYKANHP